MVARRCRTSIFVFNSYQEKYNRGNSKLFKHLHQIKAHKLDQLIGPQIINDSSPENLKTVVTIPENLLLSDSEKSVLSKGLNFVPISKKPTNFQLSKTMIPSPRSVESLFFMTKRMILSPRTKILSKHSRFESLNGLPQRASSHL